VLAFLLPAVAAKLAVLAVHAGVAPPAGRASARAQAFVAAVAKLNRDLRIPTYVKELREEDIPALASAACREAETSYPVPRYMSPATCEKLLRGVLPPRGRARGGAA
jgi:alcohol dehydrogenase class IV